jgi:hypothetical protein
MPLASRMASRYRGPRFASVVERLGCRWGCPKMSWSRSEIARPQAALPRTCGRARSMHCYGAALTIASVVKKLRSTAPILMYQHSRSGVFCPGR